MTHDGHAIDENARRRFESALRENPQSDIAQFLPLDEDPRYRATLEELVLIDLEFRWKNRQPASPDDTHHSAPLLEHYLDRFSALRSDEVVPRLLAEECWIRQHFGDRPTKAEYLARFPGATLAAELRELLPETAAEGDSAQPQSETRFQVLDEHARGGMGVVMRARDLRFDREVAVKQLSGDLSNHTESRRRFVTEANISARLEHPGIVPVYDFGVNEQGSPYYAMKLVRGKTLTELIRRHHSKPAKTHQWRLESRRLLNILVSVARTVAFAHSRGVIHRDLKPDNIIVGDFGETVLLDWGLAKVRVESPDHQVNEQAIPAEASTSKQETQSGEAASPPQLTMDGALLGTPLYMAPEQAQGRVADIDERTDVYALGAVLYQLLTGQLPLEADTVSQLIEKINHETPRRPRTLQPAIARPVEAICLRALCKEPQNRYQDVEALIDDLERFEADEPVSAYREPWWWKSGRWIKRHRTLVTVAAISLLLISVGAVLGFIQWDRARQDRLKYYAEIRAAARSAASSAEQAIFDGRFQLAWTQLQQALEAIPDQPELESTRQRLIAIQEPLHHLLQFRILSDRAEQVAFFDRDRDAIRLMERSLAHLNVFDHWDWWDQLTGLELAPKHLDRLRQDVYRLQLLLTSLRLKRGILESISITNVMKGLFGKNPNSKRLFEKAHQSAAAAHRFRHAEATGIAMQFCQYQMGQADRLPDVSSLNPRNQADNYMIGLCLLYAHVFSDSPLAKPILSVANLKEPLRNAQVMLTNASLFEPEYYWNAVWYGWASETSGQLDAALVAYSRCVALRPDYAFSYVNRADALVGLAGRADRSSQDWINFMRHALRDLQHAGDLAPGDPTVAWRQANCLNQIGGEALAEINAQLRAVLREPPLELIPASPRRTDLKASIENAYRNGDTISQSLPETTPPWLLRACCALRLGNLDEARKSAEKALTQRQDSVIAHVVLGEVHLIGDNKTSAAEEFSKARKLDNTDFLAAWGEARLADDAPSSLSLHKQLFGLAANDWQRVEALRGQALALVQLGRLVEAESQWRAARDIRPSLSDETILSALEEASEQFPAEANKIIQRLDDQRASRETPAKTLSPAVGMLAPLLNGGFELSLARHWGQISSNKTLRNVWFNVGQCQSTARPTTAEKHGEHYSLRIDNPTPEGKNVFGATQQRVPIIANAKYRLRLWAKARQLGQKSFHVVVGKSSNRVIRLDPGTYGWTQFHGDFRLSTDEAMVRLRMRSPGTVWIDDLSLELLELPESPGRESPAEAGKAAKK